MPVAKPQLAAWILLCLIPNSLHAELLSPDKLCSYAFSPSKNEGETRRFRKERLYTSLNEVEFIPRNYGERTRKIETDRVKDEFYQELLPKIRTGVWKKVYRHLKDGRELHYFEHLASGTIYYPKFKNGESMGAGLFQQFVR